MVPGQLSQWSDSGSSPRTSRSVLIFQKDYISSGALPERKRGSFAGNKAVAGGEEDGYSRYIVEVRNEWSHTFGPTALAWQTQRQSYIYLY